MEVALISGESGYRSTFTTIIEEDSLGRAKISFVTTTSHIIGGSEKTRILLPGKCLTAAFKACNNIKDFHVVLLAWQ